MQRQSIKLSIYKIPNYSEVKLIDCITIFMYFYALNNLVGGKWLDIL